MTPLETRLIDLIEATGPMRLDRFMAACLLDPQDGYYTRAEPFGAAGDFVTAPEVSQMFGELLGLWLAQCWLDQGAPGPFVLAELGPGRGTLMADALRATRGVPGFHAAMQLVLVEASPRLRTIQRARLQPYAVTWADTVDALPDAPLFVLANEFFDALPVRQFTRVGDAWAETMVAVQDGALVLARAAPAAVDGMAERLARTPDGAVVEWCPAAVPVAAALSGRIARRGGAGLVVDYGGWDGTGDTVQAVRDHAQVPVLSAPGQTDLTAHVDFAPIAGAARAAGLRALGPVGQGAFLERLGLSMRADRLAAGLAGEQLQSHRAAQHRLTCPTEMGTVFKALAFVPPAAPIPAGFET